MNKRRPQDQSEKEPVFIEGEVKRFVPGGYGIITSDEGTVLVSGACVGESVIAQITRRKKSVRFASVTEVTVAAEGARIESDCEHHPRCGGCPFIEHSEQSAALAKSQMAKDALRRLSGFDERTLALVDDVSPKSELAEAKDHKRRRATITIAKDGRPGFHGTRSRHVLSVNSCSAMDSHIEDVVRAMWHVGKWPVGMRLNIATDDKGTRSAHILGPPTLGKKQRKATIDRLVDFGVVNGVTSFWGVSKGSSTLKGVIAPSADGGPFVHDASSFSQSTKWAAKKIIDDVIEGLSLMGAKEGDHVLELFSGAGHITFPMLDKGLHVTAVENAPAGAHFLKKNIEQTPHKDKVSLIRAFVDDEGPSQELKDAIKDEGQKESIDWLVADPPRTGMPGLSAFIDAYRPRGIVLVSCDMGTGAYSIKQALEKNYQVRWVRPFDAFPRTHHVEWVCVLERNDDAA